VGFFFGFFLYEGSVTILSTDNSFDNTAVFCSPNSADLIWSEWEDASIVYDPRSGHTQVLNEFSRELFALYEDGPKNLSQLFFEFEKIIETKLDDQTKANIIEAVSGFDTMGLIEPV